MINFWLVYGLLTFVACLFVFIPALRITNKHTEQEADQRSSAENSREQENVSIFRERIAELELERNDNIITDVLYEQRKQELEIALLNDVSEQKITVPRPSSNRPFLTLGITISSLLFIAFFSFWLYQENGSKALVDEYYAMNFDAQELDNAKELARQGDMTALLSQLHEKLKSAPNNIEGWNLLARSAMNVQEYGLASEAYQQIIRIYEAQNENPAAVYGLLAQAKYYVSDGIINADVTAALQKALSLDKNELNALGLLAIDAFSNKRFQEAKDHWVNILSVYPEHPAKASIEAGIHRVNAELGLNDDDYSSVIHGNILEKSPSIVVSVSIDESLTTKVDPSTTVFILAKQVTGAVSNPNVPLAVSRHRVDEFPLTVTLDDSMSMAPIAKLSMADTVMVVARISKSGNPIAQEGDFEAVSSDIDPYLQTKIDLVIQSEVQY